MRERPGENTGPVWDQVTRVPNTEPSDDVPSDNIISTVTPIVERCVKDVVTEHVEKVKVNILQTTTFSSVEIDEVSTVINEQFSEGTSLTTTSTTTLSTITPPPPTTTIVTGRTLPLGSATQAIRNALWGKRDPEEQGILKTGSLGGVAVLPWAAWRRLGLLQFSPVLAQDPNTTHLQF